MRWHGFRRLRLLPAGMTGRRVRVDTAGRGPARRLHLRPADRQPGGRRPEVRRVARGTLHRAAPRRGRERRAGSRGGQPRRRAGHRVRRAPRVAGRLLRLRRSGQPAGVDQDRMDQHQAPAGRGGRLPDRVDLRRHQEPVRPAPGAGHRVHRRRPGPGHAADVEQQRAAQARHGGHRLPRGPAGGHRLQRPELAHDPGDLRGALLAEAAAVEPQGLAPRGPPTSRPSRPTRGSRRWTRRRRRSAAVPWTRPRPRTTVRRRIRTCSRPATRRCRRCTPRPRSRAPRSRRRHRCCPAPSGCRGTSRPARGPSGPRSSTPGTRCRSP